MKYILLLFITLNFKLCYSQNYDYYAWQSGSEVSAMAIKDNFLYFGASYNFIFKINLLESPSQPYIPVVGGTGLASGLLFIGNDLYIAQYWEGKITKIDVSISNPTIHTIVENLGTPSSILLHNNYLYIAEATANKISRINLDEINPELEDVVYANSPVELQLYNDELYIAEKNGNLISKIDLNNPDATKEDVLINIESPNGIIIKDDILYYEANNSPNQNLYKVNLLELNESPVNLNMPYWHYNPSFVTRWIIDSNNTLYRSKNNNSGADGILKYDLNEPLSVNEESYKPKISFYPNPASQYITFNNLNKKTELKIINTLGQIIDERVIYKGEQLNVDNLDSGIYFLEIDGFQILKLVKK